MPNDIDLELDAFLGGLELPDITGEGVPDAVDEFVETAKLAGQVGWTNTDGLSAESARIEKNIQRRDNSPAPPAAGNDPQRLEKRYAETGIVAFLKSEIAAGRTAMQGVERWRAENPSKVSAALTEKMTNLAIALDDDAA